MRSGVRRTRSASRAESGGCGHSPVASWRARRSSGRRVACMATAPTASARARPRRGRVDTPRGAVLYRPAMEQARVLAASRRMFIDGQWVEASNGATYAVPNPATEEPIPTRVSEGMLGTQVNSGIVYRHPAGVCGLIPTWNFPLFVTVQKLGPALATGCTMVFKPSPYAPLVNLLLAEIVAAADLPPGVVNFVTGQSNAIAETLVSDPRIDKVSFTGSVATGKRIMEAAAKTLKRV